MANLLTRCTRFLPLVAAPLFMMYVACAPAESSQSTPTQAVATPTITVEPTFTPTPTATPTPKPQPNTRSTKEYLLSLPLAERQRVIAREQMRKENEFRNNSGLQVTSWIQENTSICKHHFGTYNCQPYILELERAGPCEWQVFRRVYWDPGDELDGDLAYFAFLGTDQAELAGDMFFYTTPETRGRTISLDMVKCWQQIGRFPPRASLN